MDLNLHLYHSPQAGSFSSRNLPQRASAAWATTCSATRMLTQTSDHTDADLVGIPATTQWFSYQMQAQLPGGLAQTQLGGVSSARFRRSWVGLENLHFKCVPRGSDAASLETTLRTPLVINSAFLWTSRCS